MSWESTQLYYEKMNRYTAEKYGGHTSAELILYSVNFERILQRVDRGEWEEVGRIVASIGEKLEMVGASLLILAANAIHKVFSQVERSVKIPVLHIVDPTGEAIRKRRIKTVGLLGTKVTMEEGFYKNRLRDRHGVEALIPEEEDRNFLHRRIFEELTRGKVRRDAKREFRAVIEKLRDRGAEGMILGCTEFSLLIQREEEIPLFDTADLHAKAAVDVVMSEPEHPLR